MQPPYLTSKWLSEVTVRASLRPLLAGLLIAILIQSPAMVAPAGAVAPPLGVILQAERARVGTNPAASGTTVFDGDLLETGAAGLLQARFGSSQAYLMAGTSAVVHQAPSGFAADLTTGTVVLSSGQGQKFRLVSDGATIQPGTAQPTVAQITWVSAKELLLTSRKGALEVSLGDDVKTVPEGSSYRMLVEPADPAAAAAGANPQSPQASGKNTLILIVVGAIAVATTVAVILAVESPSSPSTSN
jgi:hypothetical protein